MEAASVQEGSNNDYYYAKGIIENRFDETFFPLQFFSKRSFRSVIYSTMTNVQKVLNSLVVLSHRLRTDEVPKSKVASMTLIPSSTLAPMLSRMTKKGLIAYGSESGTLVLTDAGKKKADPQNIPTSNKECHEEIKKNLKSGKARDIFHFLSDGKAYSKDMIMKEIGCTKTSTFAPLLSRELKKSGFIEYIGKSEVQLTDTCFPFGRP